MATDPAAHGNGHAQRRLDGLLFSASLNSLVQVFNTTDTGNIAASRSLGGAMTNLNQNIGLVIF